MINDFVKAEIELASILAILFEVVVRSREYILVIFKELSISCDFVDFLVEVNLVISIGVAAVNVWASVFRIVLKDDTVELLVVIEDASVVKIDLFVEVDAVVKAGVKIVVLIVDVVLVEVEFFVKVEVKKVVEGLIEDTGVWVVEILITFELIVIIDIEGGGAVSVDVYKGTSLLINSVKIKKDGFLLKDGLDEFNAISPVVLDDVISVVSW